MPVIAPQKPSAPTRPAKAEAKDHGLIAHVAWLDFQLAKCDIDVILERLKVYAARLFKASCWFTDHDPRDPLYHEATVLRSQLEHDECGDRALLQSRAMGAVHHLWNCVLAVDLTESRESLADDLKPISAHCATQRGSTALVERVRAIVAVCWQELLPKCPIPAYMPDDHRANWVEWRLGAVPTWSLDELQEALEEKRKR